MGIWNYLGGDATELGAKDRRDEDVAGRPLSSSWSAGTSLRYGFSWPGTANAFAETYKLGSDQESQAIRNAQAMARLHESPVSQTQKGSSMNDLQGFQFQARCCAQIIHNLDNLILENQYILKRYSNDIDYLKRSGVMSEFWPELDRSLEDFTEHVSVLVAEANKHIAAFGEQISHLNKIINQKKSQGQA